MNGLFKIDGFNEAGENDILKMELNENSDVTIPVPDGDKEEPKNKGKEEEIKVPASATIDVKTYNAALSNLQKTFQEAANVASMLMNATVVNESVADFAESYVNDALDAAYCEAVENGAIFEKVDKSDKGDIKDIVSKVRSDVEKICKENDVKFYIPKLWARTLIGLLGGPTNAIAAMNQIWNTRLWQVVGSVCCEQANISDFVKTMNEKCKEALGDYKFIEFEATQTIVDFFRTKFGWKNQLKVYFIIVDKKMPEEIKKAIKDAEKAEQENTEVVKESVECTEEMRKTAMEKLSDDQKKVYDSAMAKLKDPSIRNTIECSIVRELSKADENKVKSIMDFLNK